MVELIDHDRMCLRHDLVDSMFGGESMALIKCIPLSVACRVDIFTLGMVDSGQFSVKSAYYLAYILYVTSRIC